MLGRSVIVKRSGMLLVLERQRCLVGLAGSCSVMRPLRSSSVPVQMQVNSAG